MTIDARRRAALAAAAAALALLVGGCTSGGSSSATPSASPAAPPATSAAAPPAAATGQPPATPATDAGGLTRVFPDAGGSTCRPVRPEDGLTNSAGATPTAATVCDYSSVAPGAYVAFTQWGDASAAQRWYQDTADLGPRIEQFDVWQAGGAQQGPLYTVSYNDRVVSTGIYEGLPYGWEIRTATLDQSNQVFNQLRFQPRTAFGG